VSARGSFRRVGQPARASMIDFLARRCGHLQTSVHSIIAETTECLNPPPDPHAVRRKRTFPNPDEMPLQRAIVGRFGPVRHIFRRPDRAITNYASPAITNRPPSAAEHKISPETSTELFPSVDEILKSRAPKLPSRNAKKVKRKLVSRDEVVAYLQKPHGRGRGLATVPPQRGRPQEVRPHLPATSICARFDRPPPEQIAGYYDASTKTVNLLDCSMPNSQSCSLHPLLEVVALIL